MRRFILAGMVVVSGLILFLGFPRAHFAEEGFAISGPDEYIVVLDGNQDPDAFLRTHVVAAGHVYKHAVRGFAAKLPPGLLEKVRGAAGVRYVEPVRPVKMFGELQTGVNRVDAELNSNHTSTDKAVDVAVLDTGVNNYSAGSGSKKIFELNLGPAKTFVTWEKGTGDNNGHGTHVAGVVGARKNGQVVVGACPGAKVWNVKVLDRNGNGTTASVLAGIDYVAANASQIEVANMSLGATGLVQSWRDSIGAAQALGVVFVVAAGNENSDAAGVSPAGFAEVLTVSAIIDTDGAPGGFGALSTYGADDWRASFSNYGPVIDIAAPGVDIWSLSNRNGFIAKASGTSQATPHVAGAVALFVLRNGRATDATGVSLLQQAVLAAAWPQTGAGGFTDNSSDGSPEPLLKADLL